MWGALYVGQTIKLSSVLRYQYYPAFVEDIVPEPAVTNVRGGGHEWLCVHLCVCI